MSEQEKRVIDWIRALGGLGAVISICLLIWNASAQNSRLNLVVSRVDNMESKGTEPVRLHIAEDIATEKDHKERIMRLETAILQNSIDHSLIMQRLATIEALIRGKTP